MQNVQRGTAKVHRKHIELNLDTYTFGELKSKGVEQLSTSQAIEKNNEAKLNTISNKIQR